MWFTLSAIFLAWVCIVGLLLWFFRRNIFSGRYADKRKSAGGSLSVVALAGCNACLNPECSNFMITLALANYCDRCGAQLPAKTDPSVKELQEFGDEMDASMVGGICSEFHHSLKLDLAPVIDGKQTAYCTRCGKKLESLASQ